MSNQSLWYIAAARVAPLRIASVNQSLLVAGLDKLYSFNVNQNSPLLEFVSKLDQHTFHISLLYRFSLIRTFL
jgi:hypothetical protein